MGGRLEGKVAVVTGASRGLGFRISEKLVQDGARVAMLARGREALDEAAAKLGDSALAIAADLTNPAEVRSVFRAIQTKLGGIDILINNAAVGYPQKIETLDDELLRAEVDTNFMAPIYCIREVIPAMRERGGGDIVNVSSESVGRPVPFLATYAASKAAIENLSRTLRYELAPDRIRVAILRSGRMGESGFSKAWTPEIRARYVEEASAQGTFHYAGGAIPPSATAQAVVDLLCLPREAHVDFMEVRSNLPYEGRAR